MAKEIKIFQPFKVEKKKEKKKRKNKIESFLTRPNAEMVIDKKRNRWEKEKKDKRIYIVAVDA